MSSENQSCDRDKCINCSKSLCSCLFSHIGLSGLVVAYTVLGGFLFYQIEIDDERETKRSMLKIRNQTEIKFMELINNISMGSNDTLSRIKELLDSHERRLLEYAFEKGWNGRYPENDVNWSYAGSILYSVTVITTIGYGHVTPKSDLGRIVTIFYALFGIPLTILYLNNIGDFLAEVFRLIYAQVCYPLCKKICRRKKRSNGIPSIRTTSADSSFQIKNEFNYNSGDTNTDLDSCSIRKMSHSYTEPLFSLVNSKISCWHDLESLQNKIVESEETVIDNSTSVNKAYFEKTQGETTHFYNQDMSESSYPVGESVPLSLTLAIMVIYIIMGAFLFTFWGEEQDYLKWSYFCFITLTTIGFGDIVPGTTVNDQNPKEKLIVSVLYVAIGLPVFAMCFKLMEDEIINKARALARKIGIIST